MKDRFIGVHSFVDSDFYYFLNVPFSIVIKKRGKEEFRK
jgi:hypothetical protein